MGRYALMQQNYDLNIQRLSPRYANNRIELILNKLLEDIITNYHYPQNKYSSISNTPRYLQYIIMNEINIQDVKNKANNTMIVMDAKDFQQITPILKSLQKNTALILKDYHIYLQNKQRKSVGIPYNLIRKFQVIKNILNQAQHILNFQCNFYKNAVDNREYEKTNQQNFFIQTMKSYDESRRYMKAYILTMEGKMQIIEEEVKKDIDFQTHRFTQFWNQIALDRLELNFSNKINAMLEVKEVLRKNTALKKMLHSKIDICRSANIKESACSSQQQLQIQNEKQQVNKEKRLNLEQDTYKVASFLNSYLIKQTLRHQSLVYQLKQLQHQKLRVSFMNKQLRNAIDKTEKQIEAKYSQYAIIYELNRSYAEDNNAQDCKPQDVRKTDFLIYMRQMQSYASQRISKYGCSFQYQKCRQKYLLNHNYSKSYQKVYRVNQQSIILKNYTKQKQRNRLKQYKEKFLKDILQERLLRRQVLQRQKEYDNLRLSNQDNNESFLIEQIQNQCKQIQSELIISNKLNLSQVKAQSTLIPNRKDNFSDSLKHQEQQIQSV